MSELRANVGNFSIEVSSSHIYLASGLPPTYDYVPWNVIRRVIADGRLTDIHMIDVGANVGDSLAHFRRFSAAPVSCVEASSYFFDILERNAAQFSDVALHRSLLVPETMVGQVSFNSNGQTGSTSFTDSADAAESWSGETITFTELMRDKTKSYIVKTDTDGFDAAIVTDLLDVSKRIGAKVPLIFFEGPSAQQMMAMDLDPWLDVCFRLQASDYGLLILTNQGLPYIYAGKSFEAARSALTGLGSGYARGAYICHYFDFIAIHDSAVSEMARLAAPWDAGMYDRI